MSISTVWRALLPRNPALAGEPLASPPLSLRSEAPQREALCSPAPWTEQSSAVQLDCVPQRHKRPRHPSACSFLHFFIQKCSALPHYTFWAHLPVKSTPNQALAQKKIKPICSDDSSVLIIWEWKGWCTFQALLSWNNGQILAEGKACLPEGRVVRQLIQPRVRWNTDRQENQISLCQPEKTAWETDCPLCFF